MNEIILTLPYPLSANRYWRSFVPKGHKRAIVTLSDEAKSYKQQVGWICKAKGIREPLAGRIAVDIELFPKRPQDWERRAARNPDEWDNDVQCLDLDNVNKVLFDALKGIAFEDDKWIWRINAERKEPDGEGRVLLRIRQLQVYSPQGSLL